MSQDGLRLLGHPPLKAGESLASFLVRASNSNFYESPKVLRELMPGMEGVRDSLFCPQKAITFECLAELTGARAAHLYVSTAHLYARVLDPSGGKKASLVLEGRTLPLLSRDAVNKLIRSEISGQFCPECLAQSAYHRSIWLPSVVSVCLEHSCLLLHRCQQCERKVSIEGIVNLSCSRCTADLRDAPRIMIDDELGLRTQQAFQAWLRYESTPASIVNSLPKQPGRVLFRVIEGLRFTVQRLASSGWPHIHVLSSWHDRLEAPYKIGSSYLTPYQSYCVYATAFRGIMNWPAEFYKLLDALTFKQGVAIHTNGVYEDLGHLYEAWLERNWQHEAFDFVQNAFDLYLGERFNIARPFLYMDRLARYPDLADRFIYMSIFQAAELLGVEPGEVRKLIDSGQLRTSKEHGGDPDFVSKVDLLDIQKARNFS